MKKTILFSLTAFALTSAIQFPLAHANDVITRDSASTSTAPRDASVMKDSQQPGKVDQSESVMPDAKRSQAKESLSVHSVMMQSSLQSAMDRLNGLKTQFQISQAPGPEVMKHAKMYSSGIKSDISQAETHEGELQSGIRSYPTLAKGDSFRTLDSSFSELKSVNESWSSKAQNSSYWQDRGKVLADIDMLQQRLSSALDKTKSFNSSDLNISYSG